MSHGQKKAERGNPLKIGTVSRVFGEINMSLHIRLGLVLLLTLFPDAASAQNVPPDLTAIPLRILVQGDTSRLPDFVVSLRREFGKRGMNIQLIEHGERFDYNIVIAQESSIGGAAAAVVVLDKNCIFVASVVRSGRVSGKGAFNASAKELAKKVAALRGIQ